MRYDPRCTGTNFSGDLVDLVTFSPSETQSLGQLIGTWLTSPSVLGLDGPLGSGKTCFVQGVAQGLGIPSSAHITSPAYTLIQEYPIRNHTLVHIDFYRLDTLFSTDLMLFEELFEDPDHIIVVEWASKFLSGLTTDFLQVSISIDSNQNQRLFRISSDSQKYSHIISQLSNYADAGT